jgi:SARP family transcriptional regulator, regulator of embCAB operon
VEFAMIGGLRVVAGDREVTLAPKPRHVLATLLMNVNNVTYVDDIATELWGPDRPVSSSTTMQTYVYQLRRVLDPLGIAITTRPSGYLLEADEGSIDVHEFERRVRAARAALPDDPAGSAELLAAAEALWRGPVLAGIDCGEVLGGHVARLEEMHLDAIELSTEAGLRSGRHRELVAELKRLVRQHPFHEAFHAQLIRALSMSGRRQEAILAYRDVRELLHRKLGIDPSNLLEDAVLDALQGGAPPALLGRRHPA